jgi:hypothetical protein
VYSVCSGRRGTHTSRYPRHPAASACGDAVRDRVYQCDVRATTLGAAQRAQEDAPVSRRLSSRLCESCSEQGCWTPCASGSRCARCSSRASASSVRVTHACAWCAELLLGSCAAHCSREHVRGASASPVGGRPTAAVCERRSKRKLWRRGPLSDAAAVACVSLPSLPTHHLGEERPAASCYAHPALSASHCGAQYHSLNHASMPRDTPTLEHSVALASLIRAHPSQRVEPYSKGKNTANTDRRKGQVLQVGW